MASLVEATQSYKSALGTRIPGVDLLIIAASEFKVVLIFNNVPYPLLTLNSIETNITNDKEVFYKAGDEKPIAIKKNNKMYAGSFSLQAGEMALMLRLFGLNDSTQIADATLAIADIFGRISRVYKGLTITSEIMNLTSISKQTVISCEFNATDITGL